MRGKARKLDREVIRNLIACGVTRRDIAERFGLTPSALNHAIVRMDLAGYARSLQPTGLRPEDVLSDLVKGFSPSRIARRHQVEVTAVTEMIARHDLMAKVEQILIETGSNKIITPYRLTNAMTGGAVITHISRPRISMHVKHLQERRA